RRSPPASALARSAGLEHACQGPLAARHPPGLGRRALVVVAEEVEEAVDQETLALAAERLAAPGCLAAGSVDRDDDVAEEAVGGAGGSFGLREGEHVRRAVAPAPAAVQPPHLPVGDEEHGELGAAEAHRPEQAARAPCEPGRQRRRPAAPHRHADRRTAGGHLSARSYAVMICCTSGWRTTSRSVKVTNSIPGMSRRIACASLSPDGLPAGRSTCVTSPVMTAFEP